MFKGEFEHTLDKKGRIILPSKFRETISAKYIESVVITLGIDKCLVVFTPDVWDKKVNKLKEVPKTDDMRFFARLFTARAGDAAIDKQGRISIPLKLRREAGIDKEIIIIGTIDHMEIWDKNTWKEYSERPDRSFDEIAKKLNLDF